MWCNWQHIGLWIRESWFESRHPSLTRRAPLPGALCFPASARLPAPPASAVQSCPAVVRCSFLIPAQACRFVFPTWSSAMTPLAAVILAAGQGTRMKSKLPKGLHRLAGKPMLEYLVEAAALVTGAAPVLVVGHGAEQIRAAFGEKAGYVTQAEQKGTGHAVRQAEAALKGKCEHVLVIHGVPPPLEAGPLQAVVAAQLQNPGPLTLLSVLSDRIPDFGRVVRGPDGAVHTVFEEAQLGPEHRRISEFNVGAYCFRAAWLWEALARLTLSPKHEYYLTDTIHLAVSDGLRVEAVTIDDDRQALGINNRVQLAELEAEMRRRINAHWMTEGVTLIDPASTYIAATG